jgi:hypothetical protein
MPRCQIQMNTEEKFSSIHDSFKWCYQYADYTQTDCMAVVVPEYRFFYKHCDYNHCDCSSQLHWYHPNQSIKYLHEAEFFFFFFFFLRSWWSLVKKFPVFYRNLSFITVTTRDRHLSVLNQMNPVHNFSPCFPEMHFKWLVSDNSIPVIKYSLH